MIGEFEDERMECLHESDLLRMDAVMGNKKETSTRVEALVHLFVPGQRVDLDRLTKAIAVMRKLQDIGYTLTYDTDGWAWGSVFCDRSDVSALVDLMLLK
ncbi:MAG TPA: hypothetical protein VLH13_03830 [Methanomassiliicoccales archaeon]|nr:hypothetical protein [Methanomassiliicoccales archaeon]